MYDPNFQNESNGSEANSQEGRLEMMRVKKLKFTLKASNYKAVKNPGLSGEDMKGYCQKDTL